MICGQFACRPACVGQLSYQVNKITPSIWAAQKGEEINHA
ncbi:MAG: hypothetical protein H6Q71_407 [Firmicutes bacterium]|jgi:hypothetical protein|nr:hypothetical protein [Bacillota bacterium]